MSSNNFDLEHDLVAPVTMSAASISICSILYFSSQLQLSQTTSEYSKWGRMKENYIVSSVFLSSLNISDRNTLIRFHVFKVISAIWSCHVQVLLNLDVCVE